MFRFLDFAFCLWLSSAKRFALLYEAEPVFEGEPKLTNATADIDGHDALRSRRRGRKLLSLLAVFFAFALIAAACGSGDDDDGSTTDEDTNQDGDSTDGDTDDSTTTDGGSTGDDDRESGDPVHGGRLVYGIEADTANPWAHYGASCAISCRMIFRTITDPLFLADADGELVPYLVEPGTVQPSEDYMTWTFDVREGIKFHDGTPLDGAAVAYNINTCRFSPLTGPIFIGQTGATGEGQTVTFTYSEPSATGPTTLRAEICGLMFSPAWLATLSNNPLLTDEQKDAATGNPAAPVGLGAFAFESYTPGNGNSFVAARNPDYWRGPNGITGEELPYLDEVEFVVAVDIQSRSNGLKGGQFDIIHTANADEIAKYQDDDEFTLLEASAAGETNYILLNVAQGNNPTLAFVRGQDEVVMDPGGLNATNPLVHLSCRRSLALALDQERFAEERGAGIVTPANGPFAPGSIGYLDDTGYPKFDLEAARAEFENCKTDSGQNPVTFNFNATNDAFNVESNELVIAMWSEAFGDEIAGTIAPIEQGQYINLALAGVFQAQGWRNHGGIDPVEQWFWWHSASASPINPGVPELALNFGRFQDPLLDAALNTIRQNPDQAARIAAAETVSRQFGENVWNIWTYWTLWGIVANPQLQNLTNLTIPDLEVPAAPVIAGKHHLTQIWCLDGNCQS